MLDPSSTHIISCDWHYHDLLRLKGQPPKWHRHWSSHVLPLTIRVWPQLTIFVDFLLLGAHLLSATTTIGNFSSWVPYLGKLFLQPTLLHCVIISACFKFYSVGSSFWCVHTFLCSNSLTSLYIYEGHYTL